MLSVETFKPYNIITKFENRKRFMRFFMDSKDWRIMFPMANIANQNSMFRKHTREQLCIHIKVNFYNRILILFGLKVDPNVYRKELQTLLTKTGWI